MEENRRNIQVNAIETNQLEPELLLRFNSLTPLLRITTLILRFYFRSKKQERLTYSKAFITISELKRARNIRINLIQNIHFPKEIQYLKNQKCVDDKSKLKSLNPKLNEDGLLIVQCTWAIRICRMVTTSQMSNNSAIN